jgi:flagellar biosynthesis GTPase FlhF
MFFVEADDIYDFDKILPEKLKKMEDFVPYEAAKLLNNKWVLCLVSKEMKRDIHKFSNSDLYEPNDNSIFEYITLESMDLTKSSDMGGYLKNPEESLNTKITKLTKNKGWIPLGSVMYMIDTVWYKGQPRYVQPFFRLISKTQQEEDKTAKEEKQREEEEKKKREEEEKKQRRDKEEKERQEKNEKRKKEYEEKQRRDKEEKERQEKNEKRKKAWEETQEKEKKSIEKEKKSVEKEKKSVEKGCPSKDINPVQCDKINTYKKQALLFHPDKNFNCNDEAIEKMQKLNNMRECMEQRNVTIGGKSKRKKMILKIKRNKSIKNKK